MSRRYDYILEDFKSLGLNFRINDLTEGLQVNMWETGWKELDDTLMAIIEVEAAEIGYGIRGKKKPSAKQMWNAAIKRGHEQRFNPVKDWLRSLDGVYEPRRAEGDPFPKPYLIPRLCKHFVNPDGAFSTWLFRWMCGAIAKTFIQERNPMLVLVSDQGKGKSYFARWLCAMGEDYFLEGAINPDSKDARLRLTDKFIHEVAELGSTTRRADYESLKEFITKKWVSDRLPYARRPINKQAICSFIGSVNHDGAGFLNDPTGSTRFLSCEISGIDWSYSALDPKALWSEAFWFFKHASEPWRLTHEEEQLRQAINAQYEMTNAIDFVIDDFIIVTGDQKDFMTAREVRDIIRPHINTTNETALYRDISRALHLRGAVKGRRPYGQGDQHQRGYLGVKKREYEVMT